MGIHTQVHMVEAFSLKCGDVFLGFSIAERMFNAYHRGLQHDIANMWHTKKAQSRDISL